MTGDDPSPEFSFDDPRVIGKIVIVGATEFDEEGRETHRRQWWGRIVAFNREVGLEVDLEDAGDLHSFPPVEEALRRARPGTYRFHSTGEVVRDPDFTYTIRLDHGWEH